ncbi:EF-P 5-aminopentanol modification-associated protein YfmH [Lapidilactobacillus achengensis]|uniref:EF-P 5-aminopentanol modification-associated protein YfmH n=1 Tax=Lapidilactobacillus achengensis TaxID=2486000 RepID=A0ABW1UR27_9LACO|nr:pitrilysin family protein [Lapidilactobacillus achengensis]
MKTMQLSNGLMIDLIDKPGYLSQFGLVMVDFGAIDRQAVWQQQQWQFPAGTAHFLEHQLFNKASGDISERFAVNQAETNAFTTPSKTAYYFAGAGQLAENLDLLGELVAQPYFTAANVEKERGIITQELNMYRDQPDWALVMGIMARLYPQEPIAEDVGGTPAALAQITPELLLAAHHCFYQPQRMRVSVVADLSRVDLPHYFAAASVWQNLGQLPAPALRAPKLAPLAREQVPTDSVDGPTKIALGFRGQPLTSSLAAMTLQVALELVLTTLFGETAKQWRQWRDAGLVDDSFQFTTTVERAFNYVLLTTNTPRPAECLATLRQAILTPATVDVAAFELARKEMLGNVMFSQDNLENLGVEAAELGFYHWDSWALREYLQTVTVEQAWQQVRQFFATSKMADYQVIGDDQD